MPTNWHDLPADQIVHGNNQCLYCQGPISLQKTKALQALRTRYDEMTSTLAKLNKRANHVRDIWSLGCPRYDFSHITDGSYDPAHLKHYYVVQLKLLGCDLDRWSRLRERIALELERWYGAAREALKNETVLENQDLPVPTGEEGDAWEPESLYEELELQARCFVEQLEEAAEENGLGVLGFRRPSYLQL